MDTMSNMLITPRVGVEHDSPFLENSIQYGMCSFPTLAFSKFDINRVLVFAKSAVSCRVSQWSWQIVLSGCCSIHLHCRREEEHVDRLSSPELSVMICLVGIKNQNRQLSGIGKY